MSEFADHRTLQYSSARHQADTAIAGMWLFLATEALFFGGLFLTFMVCRHQHPQGFALAARHTNVVIGAVNTALLLTSSAACAAGVLLAERRRRSGLLFALAVTAGLATAFLVLKGFEWRDDFANHLFPGPDFGLAGEAAGLSGVDGGAAQLFFSFYFVATGVHGAHMLVGLGLLAWLAWRTRRGEFDGGWTTPVEVVGLYWSFVDMVWLILFPMIYLMGRA